MQEKRIEALLSSQI